MLFKKSPAAIAVVALVDVHVDQVLELLQLGEPLPGVVGQAQALQLALGVEAEQDGVEDVHVDQGARLVRVAVRLLGLVLWGMKILEIKIYEDGCKDDLTVPDEVGDVLDGLQVVRLLRVREGLLLQSLGIVTCNTQFKKLQRSL